MTAYLQWAPGQTKQSLVGPGDNVAIEVEGKFYPLNFVSNDGASRGDIHDGMITLQNFGNSLGSAIQFVLPGISGAKKLNIYVVEMNAGQAYRLITWSVY